MFTAATIAESLECSKKTVHRRAVAEGWRMTQTGNQYRYEPPAELAALLVPDLLDGALNGELVTAERELRPTSEVVTFADIAGRPEQAAKVRAREAAVLHYQASLALGVEAALRATVAHVLADIPQGGPALAVSTRSLRRWAAAYAARGIDGLVEQKLGVSGRKGIEIPEELRRFAQSKNVGHGSIARAARVLMTHPDLPAQARMHLHEGHASKSYVTPSIRKALLVPPLVKDRLTGAKAARLAGRFTPQDWSMVAPNDIWCSDDMTGNGVCWVETPHSPGWRLGQPQILPIIDCGTLRWLNLHVILRESGQYTSDDIAGLMGDTFDKFGLPRQFILEGGHWQSNAVIGHRTGIADEDRIGGLASLGVEVIRSYDPRNKPIEQAFNQLQYVMDDVPGYTGRDARSQTPEITRKRIALCKSGKHHPREFFPHISQLADHVRNCMERLNHERQDGKVLRGRSPLEAWGEGNAAPRMMPDSSRWLYRSAVSVSQVTSNGARVTQGSGAKMNVYYYDNPELLIPRQGRKVLIYWNQHNPDADAIIVDHETRKYAGVAKRVPEPGRYGAAQEDIDSEKARKKAANAYLRTESRAINVELQRTAVPVPVAADAATGEAIQAAADRADAEEAARRATAREVRNTPVTLAGIEGACGTGAPRQDEAEARGERDDITTVIDALYGGGESQDAPARRQTPRLQEEDSHLPF